MEGPQFAAEEAEVVEEIDWLEAEGNTKTLQRELLRLKRRAKKKPLVVILLAMAAVSLVLFKLSRRVPLYEATIDMRATEGRLVEEMSPLAGEGLANYLYTVALNTERLNKIVEKRNLFPEREDFGPLYAVNKLRDSLDIGISNNYFFSGERYDEDPQRTVNITLSYSSFDPQEAFDIALDLSAALIEAEMKRRLKVADDLRRIADTNVNLVEAELKEKNNALAQVLVEIDKAKRGLAQETKIAELTLAAARLRIGEKETSIALERISARRDLLVTNLAAEGASQALRFEIVDVRRPIIQPKRSSVAYAILALFLFICLVPLVAIALGAFDSRLHDIDDLVRLGMPVLGHLPAFPSDRMGSLRNRSRKTKHVA